VKQRDRIRFSELRYGWNPRRDRLLCYYPAAKAQTRDHSVAKAGRAFVSARPAHKLNPAKDRLKFFASG